MYENGEVDDDELIYNYYINIFKLIFNKICMRFIKSDISKNVIVMIFNAENQ
jgi:hypothetical protein